MGWSFGYNDDGREVGYAVKATCDKPGCEAEIDRGLAYVCGEMHSGDEHSCGRYFCGEHLLMGIVLPNQMCEECAERYERENPELVEAAFNEWRERHGYVEDGA